MTKSPFHRRFAHVLFLEIAISVLLTLGALFLFLKIGHDVLEKEVFQLDTSITNFIYTFRNPDITELMKTITFFGGSIFLLIVSLIATIYIFSKKRKDALIYFSILYIGVLLNLIMKLIFQRPRPTDLSLVNENSYSFPSAHAMNSFVFYVALSYFIFRETKNLRLSAILFILFFVLIICIGISRIYLGVHYPSDVLVGYIAGFLWLVSAILFEKTKFLRKLFGINKK